MTQPIDAPWLKCHRCHLELDHTLRCAACGFAPCWDEGVLIMLEDSTRSAVDAISTSIIQDQSARGVAPRGLDLQKLPESVDPRQEKAWRPHREDLAFVSGLLRNAGRLDVLEIGPWNGWLSHHLARMQHRLVTTDYFIDEVNGLKCHRYYREKWLCIQSCLDRLDVFCDNSFDLVIFNRCLQFMREPAGTFERAVQLAKPGGRVVVLGLTIASRPELLGAQFAQRSRAFEASFGLPINCINDNKGYISHRELAALRHQGLQLQREKSDTRTTVKFALSRFIPSVQSVTASRGVLIRSH